MSILREAFEDYKEKSYSEGLPISEFQEAKFEEFFTFVDGLPVELADGTSLVELDEETSEELDEDEDSLYQDSPDVE